MSAATDMTHPVLDPITVEVIGSALTSITEEMGEALVRASYSTNIKERRDCSTALFDTAGNTLCQAEHIPMHLGSFLEMVPHIMKRHPLAQMRPGDVFVGNDAYEGGGTHLPDIVLAEPVFCDNRIVAWAINTAHHSDFADRGHAHIFQEGIRIPPIRLYRAGELQKDVQDMILLNCQVPRERLSDLRAQMAANRTGVLRMQALCERYGVDTVLAAGAALQDYAERKMRAAIGTIPDGTYRFADVFDNPEMPEGVNFTVEITVRGDEMDLHFTAPPQVRAGLNMTRTALLTSVYYAVKAALDPTILPNAGLARPLRVTATENSVIHCGPPAAINGRAQTCQRVADLIHGALAPAIPGKITAAHNGALTVASFIGTQPGTGEPWVYLETIGGGFGARPTKDGLDGVHVHVTNTSNLPAEAMEGEYPLSLLAYELIDNSGGPGKYRGGMGLKRVYRAEAECRVRMDGSRMRFAPWGLEGGGEGGRSRFVVSPTAEQTGPGSYRLNKGDIVEIYTPGAGGHGDPRLRDPETLARDAREGRYDTATLRDVFGFEGNAP